jgi:hypothetical protein
MKPYVTAMAALVPAEVLAAHGALLSVTTKEDQVGGKPVTTITEPSTLKWVFIALTAFSALLYMAGRAKSDQKWDGWDIVRVPIPAAAFVAWLMLQKSTAFDAIAPGMKEAPRYTIAVLGAIVLAAIAGLVAYKIDGSEESG